MSDDRPWKRLSTQSVMDHPILSVDRVVDLLPGGDTHEFVVLGSPDWVNIVPVTPDGKAVLIRQYRHGSRRTTLEIPGGLVDPGETPAQAAAREMREETGYSAEQVTYLGKVNPNPALFSNTCHTYLASGATPAGHQHLDETERIDVELVDLDRLPGLVADGVIDHSLVIAALTFFWLRGGGLPLGGK